MKVTSFKSYSLTKKDVQEAIHEWLDNKGYWVDAKLIKDIHFSSTDKVTYNALYLDAEEEEDNA